jgi:hypothetical protein
MVAVMIRKKRECAKLLLTGEGCLPETGRELFEALPDLPGFRAEVIEGSVILSPLGTPDHARCAMRLNRALIPTMEEHGWEGYTGNIDVCVDGPREPVAPDFVMAPADCPLWGERELRSSGLIMVAEVVSKGSAARDRTEKPHLYATGDVPIYLLIDIVAEPQTVTVYSGIDDGEYRVTTTVPIGAPILLPDPVNVKLDTSIFRS